MAVTEFDAETAVLGSLLIDPQLAGEVFHQISPDDFHDPTKRNIFAAARDLFFERRALDPVTVVERAGKAYAQSVADIIRATPTSNNCGEYMRLLKDGAALRRMQTLGLQLCSAPTAEAGRQILASAQELLSRRQSRRARTYAEMVSDFLDRMADPTPPDLLDFGISQLNAVVKISKGRFVIIGADSSTGKTAFALQMAYNLARGGKRVGFFSYETSLEDAGDRVLSNSVETKLGDIKAKKVNEYVMRRALNEGLRADKIPLTVIESAGDTVAELRAETLCRQFDVIFIDYVQIVPSTRAEHNRFETVTETSILLHAMAQQLGVTIVALSQVTPPEPNLKTGKRRRLRKEDLRESRQLIQDAEAILMMDLETPDDTSSPRLLICDKNKDGPLGQVKLDFDPEHMRFTYHARDDAPPPVDQVKLEEYYDDGPIPF